MWKSARVDGVTYLQGRRRVDGVVAVDLISAQVLVEGAREERLGAHAEAHAATTVDGVYVPYALEELCTARVAVTEWIDGVKLSTCPPHEIKRLTPVAQEAFLVQLLEAGIFHADPHPGNLFRKDDGQLAILDFGLVARVRSEDQHRLGGEDGRGGCGLEEAGGLGARLAEHGASRRQLSIHWKFVPAVEHFRKCWVSTTMALGQTCLSPRIAPSPPRRRCTRLLGAT